MTNTVLTEVACPNCLAPIDIRQHGKHVTCTSCNSQFLFDGHLCPSCTTYHKDVLKNCTNCNYPLSRTCLKCKTVNWSGDEYCAECGSAMDILDAVGRKFEESSQNARAERMSQVRRVRETSEKASKARLERMRKDGLKRQAALAAKAEQRRQQSNVHALAQ